MTSHLRAAGLMLMRRRSRCAAGRVAAGKRCTPGRGDLGVCPKAVQALAGHMPRRLNKTLRAVCRLWGAGPARLAHLEMMN